MNKPTDDNQAMWIWHTHGEDADSRMIRFGKTFEAEKLPAQYTLQVCADSRYILRVNGTTVSRGPCRHKDRYRYADTVDIAPYLRRGENRLEADVIHYGDGMLQKNDLSGVPVSVEHTTLGGLLVMDGGELELSSNQSWSCSHRSGYHFVMRYPWLAYIGYNEEVDFRVQDSWKPAEIQCSSASYTSGGLAGVWILEPRPVPQPYESGRRFPAVLCGTPGIDWTAWLGDGEPLTIPPHTQAEVWLDPGEYETAFPWAEAAGGRDAVLTLSYTEKYDSPALGRLRAGERAADQWDDTYILDGALRRITPFYYRAFRFCRLAVKTGAQPVTLRQAGYVRTGYPLEVTGAYRAADPAMNTLWEISRRTLERCMYETYMDCPGYEQMQYSMDTMLEMLYTYQISADDRLARKAIRDFSLSQLPDGMLTCNAPASFTQIIPGFAVYWVRMVYDHYRYYADTDFVREYLPCMERILRFFEKHIDPATGLVADTGYWQFVDWVDGWERGCPTKREDNYIYSMMAAAMFRMAGELFEALGYVQRQRECLRVQRELCRNLNRLAWDGEHQLYRDAVDAESFSQHGQLWAVLGGVCTDHPGRAERIMRRALNEPLAKVSYCMAFFLMRALEEVGLLEEAAPLWEGWRRMAMDGATTWKEDSISGRSECHAWSSLPLYEFAACHLGVQPAAPGYAAVRIAPRALWLGECAGAVATCRGPVKVEWRLEGKQLRIAVELPQPCDVLLSLPGLPERPYRQATRIEETALLAEDGAAASAAG